MLPQPAARKAALQRVLDAGAYVALLEELADSVQGAATRPSTLDGAALGAADVALVKAVFDAVDETDSHAVLEVQLASGVVAVCCVPWLTMLCVLALLLLPGNALHATTCTVPYSRGPCGACCSSHLAGNECLPCTHTTS